MYEPNYITEAQVNHLCLCTGYDGVGRGLRKVFPNLRTVAYVEIEAFVIANLVTKIEEGEMDEAPIFTDVKTFPYRKFRGCVDILSAGFPCQPFSVAGRKQGVEDPRHLYPFIANGITLCKPRYVLLENVEGIVSSKTANGESVLLHVLKDLESRGYKCAWGTFSASEIGAPHLRKRIFILAKLGYSEHHGLSTSENWGGISKKQEERGVQESEGRRCKPSIYPARPGEKQYEWECPRLVSDSKSKRRGRRENTNYPNRGGVQELSKVEQSILRSEAERCGGDGQAADRKAESDMGGADDGNTDRLYTTTNRVDRLRLLGNGVVPDTCALAVRTLWNKLN